MEGMLREEARAAGRPRWWGRLAGRVSGLVLMALMAACTPTPDPIDPPKITGAPQSTTVDDGAAAGFSVAATGNGLAYQWQRNGSAVAGATGASYTIAAAALADDGARFSVVVSNGGGSVTSTEAVLSVRAVAPSVATAPQAATAYEGRTATFTVAASGSAPLSYQWLRAGIEIAGATAASYTTPALTLADDGAAFSVRVNNAASSVTSTAAALTVNPLPAVPTFATAPRDTAAVAGQTATFTADAVGAAPLAYQWQRDGSAIAGATAASYTTPVLTAADNGARFAVTVTDAAGQATTSTAAVLSVSAAPPAGARLYMGTGFVLALRADDSVIGWGNGIVPSNAPLGSGLAGSAARVAGIVGAAQVVAGLNESLVLLGDGSVRGYGLRTSATMIGGDASLTAPEAVTSPLDATYPAGVRQLATAQAYVGLARLADGTVWYLPGTRTPTSVGRVRVDAKQVPGLAGVTWIGSSGGGNGRGVAVKGDGTVWTLFFPSLLGNDIGVVVTQVIGLPASDRAVCGPLHCLALARDGTVWAWGDNTSGALGDGTTTSRTLPVKATGLTGVVHIAAGQVDSHAITADGQLWSWGDRSLSGIGSGSGDLLVPTAVPGFTDAVEISTGNAAVLRRRDGSVWAWGSNNYGELGDGTTGLGSPVPARVPGIDLN